MALFASPHQDGISCDTLKMNQLCKVCGEPAAGFHFGAFTCEGCKSFFGRSYNNLSVISECKNGGQCVINKKNRTSCKACRLRKCLLVGMSKSGSRYGRRSNWFKLHCLMQEQSTPPPPSSSGNDPHSASANANNHNSYNSSGFPHPHHHNHRRHYSLSQQRHHPSTGTGLRPLPSSMSNESSSNKDDPEDYKTSSSPSVSSPADSHNSDSSSVELSEVKPSHHHLPDLHHHHHHHHPLHPYNFKLGATLTPIHSFYDGKDLFAPTLAGLPHHLHAAAAAAAANLNLHQHQQHLQHAAVVAASGGFLPPHFPTAQPASLISTTTTNNSTNNTSLGSSRFVTSSSAKNSSATLLPRKFHIDTVLQLGSGGHNHHPHPLPKLAPLMSPASPESRAALAEQDTPMDLSFKGKQTCVEPGSPRCSDLDSDMDDFHDATNEDEHVFLFQRSDEEDDDELDDLKHDRVSNRKHMATPLDLTRKSL